jgi:predicted DCC family thiol-disulfide oxidoreductase YuxK
MKPTMFYDGACPLCRREVEHYRRLDREGRVLWVDISRDSDGLASHGIPYQAAMERLHAIDEQGRVVSGVPAFLVVWRQLPGFRHLAGTVERLGLESVLDRIYVRFAAWRFKRRCADGVCHTRPASIASDDE